MVAGLLALLLGVAPASAAPNPLPFRQFSFRYETGWGDLIDTRDSTIAHDNCEAPPSRGRATLSVQERRRIYDRLIGLRAFDLPMPRPEFNSTSAVLTSPSTWIHVELRVGKSVREFRWDGKRPDPLPADWIRMYEMGTLLRESLQSMPAYQQLPHQECLRQ